MKERFTGPRAKLAAGGIAISTVVAGCNIGERVVQPFAKAFPCDPNIIATTDTAAVRRTDPIKIPPQFTGGQEVTICFPMGEQTSVKPTLSTEQAVNNLLTQKDSAIRDNITPTQIDRAHNRLWTDFKTDLSITLPDDEKLTKNLIKKDYFKIMFNPDEGSNRGTRGTYVISAFIYAYDKSTSPGAKKAILQFTYLAYDYIATIAGQRDALNDLVHARLDYWFAGTQ